MLYLIPQVTKVKRNMCMAQEVEHLASKCEASSSIPPVPWEKMLWKRKIRDSLSF
jgi:hypothetical protein